MTALTEALSDAIGYGLLASRPTAGIAGRLYFATDSGNAYRDNGSSWDTLTIAAAAALTVYDEGSPLATAASSLDFVGAGVTASGTGASKTITIPSGAGFRASNNATQTPANATYEPATLNTEQFDTNAFHFTSDANLTGTVSKTAASTTITGSGTSFTTELSVNQIISVPGTAEEWFVVRSIASNTSLTTWAAAANTASGQTGKRISKAFAVPAGMGGSYIVGASSSTAGSTATGLRRLVVKQNSFANDLATGAIGWASKTEVAVASAYSLETAPIFVQLSEGDYVSLMLFTNGGGGGQPFGATTAPHWTTLGAMRI